MHNPRISQIKREQRKSFLLRELSNMLHALCDSEPQFMSLFISQVDLSDDGGICYVYMSAMPSEKATAKQIFENLLPALKLYKPSMRKNLANAMQKRYVPNIKFLFDEKKEKVDKVNELLDRVQNELDKQESPSISDDNQEE